MRIQFTKLQNTYSSIALISLALTFSSCNDDDGAPAISEQQYEYHDGRTQDILSDNLTSNTNTWILHSSAAPNSIQFAASGLSLQNQSGQPSPEISKHFDLDGERDFEMEYEFSSVTGKVACATWADPNSSELRIYGFFYNRNSISFTADAPSFLDFEKDVETDLIANKFYKITMRKVNGKFYFFIDEKLFHQTVADTFNYDELRFRADNGTITYKNLSLKYLN